MLALAGGCPSLGCFAVTLRQQRRDDRRTRWWPHKRGVEGDQRRDNPALPAGQCERAVGFDAVKGWAGALT